MLGQAEKVLRKEMAQARRESMKHAAIGRLPAGKPVLKRLFNSLDEHLIEHGCDHTLCCTQWFVAIEKLPGNPP